MTRMERIEATLRAAFAPTEFTLTDDSHLHRGHAGASGGLGHFTVFIRSDRFSGLSAVARHRAIYVALADLLKTDIHALAITAKDNQES